MAKSFIVALYLDSDDAACHTDVGYMGETGGDTWSHFLHAKRYDCGTEKAAFLLDYYNRKGDLADTVALTAEDYTRVTGAPVLSEAEYRAIDAKYSALTTPDDRGATA